MIYIYHTIYLYLYIYIYIYHITRVSLAVGCIGAVDTRALALPLRRGTFAPPIPELKIFRRVGRWVCLNIW